METGCFSRVLRMKVRIDMNHGRCGPFWIVSSKNHHYSIQDTNMPASLLLLSKRERTALLNVPVKKLTITLSCRSLLSDMSCQIRSSRATALFLWCNHYLHTIKLIGDLQWIIAVYLEGIVPFTCILTGKWKRKTMTR